MELDAEDTTSYAIRLAEKQNGEGASNEAVAGSSQAPSTGNLVNGTLSVHATSPSGDSIKMTCTVEINSDWTRTKNVVQALMSEMLDQCVKEHEEGISNEESSVLVAKNNDVEDAQGKKGVGTKSTEMLDTTEETKVVDETDSVVEAAMECDNAANIQVVGSDNVAQENCKEETENLSSLTDTESDGDIKTLVTEDVGKSPSSTLPTLDGTTDQYNDLEKLFLGLSESCDQTVSTASNENQETSSDTNEEVKKCEELSTENGDTISSIPKTIQEPLSSEPKTVPNIEIAVVPNKEEGESGVVRKFTPSVTNEEFEDSCTLVDNDTDDDVTLLVEYDAEQETVCLNSCTDVDKKSSEVSCVCDEKMDASLI